MKLFLSFRRLARRSLTTRWRRTFSNSPLPRPPPQLTVRNPPHFPPPRSVGKNLPHSRRQRAERISATFATSAPRGLTRPTSAAPASFRIRPSASCATTIPEISAPGRRCCGTSTPYTRARRSSERLRDFFYPTLKISIEDTNNPREIFYILSNELKTLVLKEGRNKKSTKTCQQSC